jgi:hypothetical protein
MAESIGVILPELNLIPCKGLSYKEYVWHKMYITSKEIYICKIWGFHVGEYEESSLLGCGAV